ncbi:MATE family efflux transporter [Clostridiaceae bacterium M8S5]|nr:MATE family efflux transporter [Clostridiaceae bacterium M8S5]
MDRTELLAKESVGKLLLKFSTPAVIGMIVNALYNVIDRYFVGNYVNSDAITGITLCFPIMIIMMAFSMLVGFGGTALVSIKLGEQKKEEAERILGNSFVLLIIFSVCIMIIGLLTYKDILMFFNVSDKVMPYAKQYITIILYGTIFQFIGFGLNNFIRGEGNPRLAASTMLIGAITNIILDYIFIRHLSLGIKGAAYATIIGQLVSALWVMKYFVSGKSLLKFHISTMSLKSKVVLKIFSLGSAPFAIQVASSVVTGLFNYSIKTYGGNNSDSAIAALGIMSSIVMFILMPIFGINQGAQPIIGYNYGAKQYKRVKKAYSYAVIVATSIVLVGFLLIQFFPRELFLLFNKTDTNMIDIGAKYIKIYMLMLPLIGFQIISSNYFQAIGKPRHSIFLSTTRQVILLIPSLLLFPTIWGFKGIWIAVPFSDVFSCIITAIFIIREMRLLQNTNPYISE